MNPLKHFNFLIVFFLSTALYAAEEEKKAQEIFWDEGFSHSLSNVIDPESFSFVKTRPMDKPGVVGFVNEGFLKSIGVEVSNLEDAKAAFARRFAFEVHPPQDQEEAPSLTAPVISLAYDDGYLGRGDGRATWLFSIPLPGQGTFDVGDKGGGSTIYSIPQESIDAGYHVAEKDGLLGIEETISTIAVSEMLHAVGIESERIIGFVENNKKTGYNLPGPNPKIEAAAKVVRAFETGLRGAHLRKYSQDELLRVSEWLQGREALRLGVESVSFEQWAHNKIQRDAERAARAQHFWILHGAINTANIYTNGWADLFYVQALQVPDGFYSSLNVYGRLNYQAAEFAKTTKQFVDTLSEAQGVDVDAETLYWETFNRSLNDLELRALGVSPKITTSSSPKIKKAMQKYSEIWWRLNYENLGTDMKRFRVLSVTLSAMPSMKSLTDDLAREVISRSRRKKHYQPDRVWDEEMFPEDRKKYLAHQKYLDTTQPISPEEELLALEFERSVSHSPALLQQSATQKRQRTISVEDAQEYFQAVQEVFKAVGYSKNDINDVALGRAAAIQKINLPSAERVRSYVEKYENSSDKNGNEILAPLLRNLENIDAQVTAFYGRPEGGCGEHLQP